MRQTSGARGQPAGGRKVQDVQGRRTQLGTRCRVGVTAAPISRAQHCLPACLPARSLGEATPHTNLLEARDRRSHQQESAIEAALTPPRAPELEHRSPIKVGGG